MLKQQKKRPVTTQSDNEDGGDKPVSKPIKQGHHKDQHKKIKANLDSFAKDEDDDRITVPVFALDSDVEEEQNAKLAQVRIKNWFKERDEEEEAIKRAKKEGEQYDVDASLGYVSAEDSPEESWAKSPSAVPAVPDELFAFDDKTGKTFVTRDLDIRLMKDYNVFPADGTIIFGGIRRSGKTFGVRDVLYHLRHNFAGGLVFSATKHNGTLIVLCYSLALCYEVRSRELLLHEITELTAWNHIAFDVSFVCVLSIYSHELDWGRVLSTITTILFEELKCPFVGD